MEKVNINVSCPKMGLLKQILKGFLSDRLRCKYHACVDLLRKIVSAISLFHFKCLDVIPDFAPNVTYFKQ